MSTAAPQTAEATSSERGPRCGVCEHDLAAHDAIGQRYCRATQALALPRGCICRTPA